jgi:DNA-binding XRE family transcriptional regulator
MYREVNRQLLTSAREGLGLSRQALAYALCLSQKHIEQLEEGGYQSFYSLQHKYQVAKKVARKLGLAEDSIFIDGYDYPDLSQSISST